MSLWPFVFRTLISLSLILNGSGYAVAATQMQMGHISAGALQLQPAAAFEVTDEPTCHPHQTYASATPGQLPDVAHDQAPAKLKHPSPDCCKSGTCLNACTQQAQTALDMPALRDAVVEHTSSVCPLKPGHATSALPHLIRPPIG